MKRALNVAIVGATGAVGETMLQVLEERKFRVETLFPIASERSKEKMITCFNRTYEVLSLEDFDFSLVDIAFFSAGNEISRVYGSKAAEQGAIVIDNSSYFRYESDIPLIIPEVNADAISNYRHRNIIANPNCSTIQMLVALKPIYDACGISRINVATYQSVSGTGKKAVTELITQLGELLNGRPAQCEVYDKQIAFNVLPHIDAFQDNGYTKEEMKMVWETQKILEDADILVNPTAVRVPVLYGHSEAIHLELKTPLSAIGAREILATAPGVTVIDLPCEGAYPTAFHDATGSDSVFVGRIREDISHPMGLNLWVVSDNMRKGAATNAIQIAEIVHRDYF